MTEEQHDSEIQEGEVEVAPGKRFALAVIGAPGSGKTEFIQKFHQASVETFQEIDQSLQVLDSSVPNVEEVLGLACGQQGSYISSLLLAMAQVGNEVMHRNFQQSYITDGTLVEVLAHLGAISEDVSKGVRTPETDAKMMRLMNTTKVVSQLVIDTFAYTFTIYMPLPEQIIVPSGETWQQNWARRLDIMIRHIIQTYRINVIELRGPMDERVNNLLDLIHESIQAEQEGRDVEALASDAHSEMVHVATTEEMEQMGGAA